MITGIIARIRSLWRGVRRRSAFEAEMSEEFRQHVELRSRDLMQSGLSPAESLRRARLEFGSVELHKDRARAARGLDRIDWLRFSWLDFKLGFRMLARYPGLTVVGGLAMAFAVWIGAGTYELVGQWVRPTLPLPEGDRIVGIQLWHTVSRGLDGRALHDFVTWREELESVEDVSAFRTVERNVFTGEGRGGGQVMAAEITASGFQVAGVEPLLGRALLASDEVAGAPRVIVIGHDVWQSHFGGDRDVVGREVQFGAEGATVVGVMPKEFAFPISHEVWTPLQLNFSGYAPLEGPGIGVLGRLARGVALSDAQSELDYLGERAAADSPDTHEHLRPRVMPLASSVLSEYVSESESATLPWINLFVAMFIVLVCGNVGLLMLARAATREGEIVVRSALGASRGRIVAQLFAEALVLGGVGAIVGLALTRPALRWGLFVLEANLGRGSLPFWVNDRLSGSTVLYAGGLTVLGAVTAGVLPALRVTRGVSTRLRQATAGGGGLKFSGIWTVVIVAQVAVTVAFPVTTFFVRREDARIRSVDVGFAADQHLSAQLELESLAASGMPADPSADEYVARFRRTYREFERRLSVEPGVEGVTFADGLPRMIHESRQVDVIEGIATVPDSVLYPRVKTASVDGDYFDVLGAPILTGRSFNAADVESGHRVVIVNQSFVD